MSKTNWIKRAISRVSIILIISMMSASLPVAQAATFSVSTANLINNFPGIQIKGSSSPSAIVRLGVTASAADKTLTSVTVNFSGTGFATSDLLAIATGNTSGVALYDDSGAGNTGSFSVAGGDTVVTLGGTPDWTPSTTNITLTPATPVALTSGVEKIFYVVIKTSNTLSTDDQIVATIPATTGIITTDTNGPASSFTANFLKGDVTLPSITSVVKTSNTQAMVMFSEPVQKVTFGNITWVSATDPFTFVDNGTTGGSTVTAISHNAGQNFATITMSDSLDSGDFDGSPSTLAAASSKIMDMAGNVMATGSANFSNPPGFTTVSIPSTFAGAVFNAGSPLVTLAAAGGTGSYTFTANSSADTTTLTGLGLSVATDGKVTGTVASTQGSFNVMFKVTDSGSAISIKQFTINVAATQGGGIPGIMSIAPATGVQSSTATVTITGANTTFSNSTTVSFSKSAGSGVTSGAVTVTSATSLSVPVTVSGSATTGSWDVTVTTGSQSATMPNGFNVVAAASGLTLLAPASAQTNVAMPPTFSFNPTSSSSVNTYRVTVKSNSDFTGTTLWDYAFPTPSNSTSSHCTSTMCNVPFGSGTFSVMTMPVAIAPNTTYYWQVRTYAEQMTGINAATPLETTQVNGFTTVSSASDMMPPSIFHSPVFQAKKNTDLLLFARVMDNLATNASTPQLTTTIKYCQGSGCSSYTSAAGVYVGNGYFKYTIPSATITNTAGTIVRYYLSATDGTNTTDFKAAGSGIVPFQLLAADASTWSSTISGTVKDSTGACPSGVQSATVFVEGTGFNTTTDSSCVFSLTNLAAGSYTVIAVKDGYADRMMNGISTGMTGLPFLLPASAGTGQVSGGVGGDTSKPHVKFTCPPDGATNMPGQMTGFKICAVFDKDMSQSTIIPTNLVVKDVNMLTGSGTDITTTKGAWVYYPTNPNTIGLPLESKMAVWTLSGSNTLGDGKTISVSIGSSVTDTAGNPVAGNQPDGSYVFSFTTGSTFTSGSTAGSGAFVNPHVVGTTPPPGTQSAPTNTKVIINFSDPMADDSGSYILKDYVKLFTVSGTTETDITSSAVNLVTLSTDKKNAAISLSSSYNSGSFIAGTDYEVKVLGGAKALTGVPLGSATQSTTPMFVSKFKTGSSADTGAPSVAGSFPDSGATNVQTALASVNVGFNKDMDASTITASNFYVSTGSSTINGSVVYKATERQAVYIFKQGLSPNTTYTINLTASIKGINGTAITAATRTFTTGAADTSAPMIQFMKCDDSGCAATFTKPMVSASAIDTLNWAISVINPSNYANFRYGSAGSSSGTAISLTNAQFSYDGETNTLLIKGLSLSSAIGQEAYLEMKNPSGAKSLDGVEVGSSGNKIRAMIQNSATTQGALAPGATSTSASTAAGQFTPDNFSKSTFGFAPPVEVRPFNMLAGQTTIYGIRLPISTQIPAGGQIVLTFPQGFDVSSAQQDVNSPMRGDLNGPGSGTINFKCTTSVTGGKTCPSSGGATVTGDGTSDSTKGGLSDDGVIVNATSRTVTIYLSAATQSTGDNAHDYLMLDISGIKNSTVPKDFNTTGYTVDIKTKSANGETTLESLTSMPIFIQSGGSYTLNGTVTATSNDQAGTIKVYLMSPATGPLETTSADFADATSGASDGATKATYSFTNLPAGEFMVFTDQSITLGSGGSAKEFVGKTTPEKASINAVTDLTSDGATDSAVKYDFTLASATTGTAVVVTLTGPANEPVDIFANSSSGFKVKSVTLNGSGACATVSACTIKLGNGQWNVGVGPQMPKGVTGSMPPAPSYLPPQPIKVGVSGATVTENSGTADDGTIVFALITANKDIQGIVKDGSGKVIANAEVFAYSPQGGMGTHAQAGTDGTFDLKVVDGSYKVGAFIMGMPPSQETPVTVNSNTSQGGSATDYLFINGAVTGITPAAALSSFVVKLAKPDYTISGKVTDGTNVVQGAGVYAYRTDAPGNANAMTNSSGTYTLYVSAGTWKVGSFLPQYGNLTEQTVTVTTANQSSIDFAPSGTGTFYTVSGTVTVGGTAKQGAFVRLSCPTTSNEAITGSDGTYTFNAPAASGCTMKSFIPGQGESAPVSVSISANTTQNFAIGAQETITVVFSSAPSKAFVELKSSTGINSVSQVENKISTTLSVPDGDYKVTINVPGVGSIPLTSVAATSGSTVYSNTTGIMTVNGAESLTVTLPTFRTVSGTVKDTAATVIADAWVDIGNSSNGMHFGTKAGSDGTFSIKVQDSATPYFINAMKPGYFREPTDLTVNGADQSAQILTMSAATATIQGTVKVGSTGVANAFVRGEKLGGGFTATQADANGAYTLSVSAGTWKTFATGPGYAEAAGSTVDVTTGATTGKDITLSVTATIDPPKTKTITPSSGGTLDDPASGLSVTAAPGALGSGSSAGTLTSTPTSNFTETSGVTVVGDQAVQLEAKDSDGNAITTFSDNVTITQDLTLAEVEAAASPTDSKIDTKAEADALQIMYWDESSASWIPIATTVTEYNAAGAVITDATTIDTGAEFAATVATVKLTALTSHFSLFAPGVATDPSAPSAAPSGLTTTATTTTSITLGWTLDSDATAGYDIYRSTSFAGTYSRLGSEPTVAATSTVTYTDSASLSAGTTYYYKISAINSSGESEASAAITTATTAASSNSGGPVLTGGSGGGGSKKTTTTTEDKTKSDETTKDTTTENKAETATTSTPLKDIVGHWAQTYIEDLYEKKIVSGADVSHYNPDKPITRAEFTKIVVNMYSIPMKDAESLTSSFKDVKESEWYAAYVQAAYDKGIVSGYTNQTFNPNKPITRAEAMKIILSASGVTLSEPTEDSKFTDVKKKDWFAKYVEYAAANGIVTGYEDGTFGYNKPITRGEVAKIADLLLKDNIVGMVLGVLQN